MRESERQRYRHGLESLCCDVDVRGKRAEGRREKQEEINNG